jgi:hypothetical protein
MKKYTRKKYNKDKDTKNKDKDTKKFKKLSCNPIVKNTINKNTCYNKENIFKLKELWNLRHPDMLISTNDPTEIWKFLKNTFKNVCNNEQCWLKQEFSKNKIDSGTRSYIFAPRAPSSWNININEWLSNIDIMNVMQNYEKIHKNFKFIGPSPIDFDKRIYENKCVWNELCDFKLTDYISKNIDKIGIVFNTDPHNKPGQHWISLFINLNPNIDNVKPYIFFFDSAGDKIPIEIENLKNRIVDMAINYKKDKYTNGITLEFIQNHPLEHQKSNTECGMYCLFFILKQLYGKPPEYFLDKNRLITDERMEAYRNKYFNIIKN